MENFGIDYIAGNNRLFSCANELEVAVAKECHNISDFELTHNHFYEK